jgi:hypothetical protein
MFKVDNTSSIVSEDDKDEQNFKANCVDGEEVHRGKLRNVVFGEMLIV